jgi:hypothetical protein
VLLELALTLLEDETSSLDEVISLEDVRFDVESSLTEVTESKVLELTNETSPPPHATSTSIRKLNKLKDFNFIRPPH